MNNILPSLSEEGEKPSSLPTSIQKTPDTTTLEEIQGAAANQRAVDQEKAATLLKEIQSTTCEQEVQEIRDGLADKLNEIRDAGRDSEDPTSKITRAKAQGYLDAIKDSGEYIEKDDTLDVGRIEKQRLSKLPEFWPGRRKTNLHDAYGMVNALNEQLKEDESKWKLPTLEDWEKVIGNWDEKNPIIISGILKKFKIEPGVYWAPASEGHKKVEHYGGSERYSDIVHVYPDNKGFHRGEHRIGDKLSAQPIRITEKEDKN